MIDIKSIYDKSHSDALDLIESEVSLAARVDFSMLANNLSNVGLWDKMQCYYLDFEQMRKEYDTLCNSRKD